jgi:hypothetical protein
MAGLCLGLTCTGATSALEADKGWREIKASSGVGYFSGRFGGPEATTILFAPLSLRYENARFRAQATVPYLEIEGPGDPSAPDRPLDASRIAGMGDATLSFTYLLDAHEGLNLSFLEVTGKIKVPTSRRPKGLGTGAPDYSIQADAFRSFGSWTPFGMLGYRWRGETELVQPRDGWLAAAGLEYEAREWLTLGAAFDYREEAFAGAGDERELSPFLVLRPSDGWSVSLFGLIGLSDGSPDAGGGMDVSRTF